MAVVNTYALRNKTPQARAEYCRLPSASARYTLGQTAEDAAAEELKLRVRSMAEISMLVTSIDPLAAYKVSDDLVMRLLNNSDSFIFAKGCLPGSLDLSQDLLSFSPPDVPLGFEVMPGEVLHDGID